MNSTALSTIWLQLLALLALEVGVLTLGLALLQRWSPSAAWRRTFCQAAIAGVLVIVGCELSGAGRMCAGWASNAFAQLHSPRPAQEDPGAADVNARSIAGSSKERQDLSVLNPAFLAEVEARLAQHHTHGNEPNALVQMGIQSPTNSSARLTAGQSARWRQPDTVADSVVVLWFWSIWVTGAALVAGRVCLAQVLFLIFRLRRRPVADQALLQRASELGRALRMRRRVRVVESARLTSPIAFGLFRPTVGLPQGFATRFEVQKQDAMLAHELAHLAAHDPIWCLLADVMTVLLWWHPAAWWIRRQLHDASEMAADEASLLLADGPRVLAECLVELGTLLSRPPLLARLQVAGFRSHLGCRVHRLVQLEGCRWSPLPGVAAALVRSFGPMAIVALVILCSAWAAPQALMKGESMKTMQLNWKRSIAAMAFLATVHAPGAAETLAATPAPAATSTGTPAATPTTAEQSREVRVFQCTQAEAAQLKDKARNLLSPKGTLEIDERANAIVVSDEPENVQRVARLMDGFRRRYGLEGSPPWHATAGPHLASPAAPRTEPKRGALLEAKLKELILPEVKFDGLPLGEVLSYLNDQSRKLDPDKKGLNFLLTSNPASGSGTVASPAPVIDPAPGLPMVAAPVEAVDMSTVMIKFNLPLRNVSLRDVLDAIVKVAEHPIEYGLEDYAVVFSPKPEMSASVPATPRPLMPQLTVRTFKVDTNTFAAGLESAFDIKIQAAADIQNSSRSRKVQSALKDLLVHLGIAMDGNKAVFYNELTGVIMVRATPEDLEVVGAAIETLGGV